MLSGRLKVQAHPIPISAETRGRSNTRGRSHMKTNFRRRLLGATALLTAAALAAPVLAQPESVGEVVVTARHRVENVQNVPVAVSVLGTDFLAKTNTTGIAQIAQLEPSVQFSFLMSVTTTEPGHINRFGTTTPTPLPLRGGAESSTPCWPASISRRLP